jgi:ribonuclease HII
MRAARRGPDDRAERAAQRQHGAPVAGIDEAGRGPWAGPVVAAAVVLDHARLPRGLDDSKALASAERERLHREILATARVGIGIADAAEIDRDNILVATFSAMARAVDALGCLPAAALVDGNRAPGLACPVATIVKGDATSLAIAAASIVAKVTRDRMMCEAARRYPGYGFERHKGYGTAEHRAAIACHGLTPLHRRSFRPIRRVLEASEGT